jgi:ABC-type branched-subunit amino acid transport system permease subunit
MKRTPLSIVLVGWLFVAVGVGSLVRGLIRYDPREPSHFAWAAASALIAIVGGVGTLRGGSWGRWVLAFWMAGHVALAAMHDWEKLAVHVALFAVIAWILFLRRPRAPAPEA